MQRFLLIFLFLVSSGISFGQDNKYSTYNTYFRYDESSLNPKTYGKLNRYFSSLKKPEIIAVFLTTYADTNLSADASKLIATNRCNTLKGYLTAIGVPGDKIKNKITEKTAPYPKNMKDELKHLYRLVQISVSYKVDNQFLGFNFSNYQLPKSVFKSYRDETCSRDTTLEYDNGLLVTMSYCDYFNRKLNLVVNEYLNDEFHLFEHQLLRFIDRDKEALSVYTFNFSDRLHKPLEIAIPISQCLSVGDHSIKSLGYDYNPSQIVEDKKSGYYKFKLNKPGTFAFQQTKFEEQEYNIEFISKNGIDLFEVVVGIQCPRQIYREKVSQEEKKMSIKLPYPNAEPQIFARGVNVDGDTLVMKFKPLNDLKSKKEIGSGRRKSCQ
jgi:hypothetical protein